MGFQFESLPYAPTGYVQIIAFCEISFYLMSKSFVSMLAKEVFLDKSEGRIIIIK